LKKPAGSVWFYKQKPKKPNRTEPKPKKTGKKPSQTGKTEPKLKKPNQNRKNQAKTGKTEPNRFEPVFALKNRTEPKPVGLTRFRFGFCFFFKNKISVWLLFLIKTESNRK
jgi:hypothetical protein